MKKQTAVGTKTVNEAAKKAKNFSAAIQPTFAKTVNGLNKLTNPTYPSPLDEFFLLRPLPFGSPPIF